MILIVIARFAFGNAIGAIESLAVAGGELQIVKQNDLQSSKMPMYTNFPSLVRAYALVSTLLFKLTGREPIPAESQKQFDVVGFSFYMPSSIPFLT